MPSWRAIVTSDLHIHPFKLCSQDNGSDRLQDGLNATAETLKLARQYDATWYCLGDLKQVRSVWNQLALSSLLDLLYDYKDVHKIILCGNHDGLGLKDSAETGLTPFRGVPKTVCITKPCVLGKDAYWPWQPTLDYLPTFLEKARQHNARRLFGHCYIEGSRIGSADIRLKNVGTSLKEFGLAGKAKERAFDIAFFGDVHKQQRIGAADGIRSCPIYIPGSPYAQNWGETEQNKGVWLASSDETTYLVNAFVVPNTPSFLVYTITDEANFKEFLKALPVQEGTGNFIRLVMPSSLVRTQSQPIDRAVNSLREHGARHVEVVVSSQVEHTLAKSEEIHAGTPPKQMLEAYVASRTPPWLEDEKITISSLVRAGLHLMEPK